jgi:hypothetical protein
VRMQSAQGSAVLTLGLLSRLRICLTSYWLRHFQMLFEQACCGREKIVGGHYSHQLPVVDYWKATNFRGPHDVNSFQRWRS